MGILTKIRNLFCWDGVTIKEIQRRTGLSRNTIKLCLREPEMVEPQYPPRKLVSKLDAYKETLNTWLKADAHPSKRDRHRVKPMFEELVAQG